MKKKNNKPKEIKIIDPIFNFHWLVIVGGTNQEAINKYAKLIGAPPWEVEDSPSRYGHFTAHRDFGKGGCIWLRSDAARWIGHEVYHAVTWMHVCMNVPQNEATEEIGAYYSEWLTGEIVANLQK